MQWSTPLRDAGQITATPPILVKVTTVTGARGLITIAVTTTADTGNIRAVPFTRRAFSSSGLFLFKHHSRLFCSPLFGRIIRSEPAPMGCRHRSPPPDGALHRLGRHGCRLLWIEPARRSLATVLRLGGFAGLATLCFWGGSPGCAAETLCATTSAIRFLQAPKVLRPPPETPNNRNQPPDCSRSGPVLLTAPLTSPTERPPPYFPSGPLWLRLRASGHA